MGCMPPAHTFRPKRTYWLRSLASLLALAVILVIAWKVFPSFTLILLILVLFGLFIGPELFRMARTYLTLDENGLRGRFGRLECNLRWQDIRLARLDQVERYGAYLTLATQGQVYPIPLQWLERGEIWKLVQSHVPPEVLSEEADQKLAESQLKAWREQVADIKLPLKLRVNLWLPVLLAGSILLYLGFVLQNLGATGQVDLTVLLCMGSLAAICLVMLLMLIQTVQIDETGLRKRTLFGRYEMKWSEVSLLRNEPGGAMLVFEGQEKRLVLVMIFLAGKEKANALDYIVYQLSQQAVESRSEARLIFTPVLSTNRRRK